MAYPTGTFLSCVMQFAVAQNEEAQVTMNWIPGSYSLNSPDADGERIAAQALTAWDSVKSLYTVGVAYQGMTAYLRALSGPAETVLEYPTSNSPGTDTGGMCPQECSPCISTRTASAGRSSRGRMFMPPPALSTLDTLGTLTGSAKDDFLAYAQLLLTPLDAPAAYPVLWSRVTPSIQPLTGLKVGAIMDVQRRRRSSANEAYVSGPILA